MCHGVVWRGEREPPSKTGAQRFEQADRVVVEAFGDLHEARRLKRNQFLSTPPGAVQRFERMAWSRLIDYLIKLPPLNDD